MNQHWALAPPIDQGLSTWHLPQTPTLAMPTYANTSNTSHRRVGTGHHQKTRISSRGAAKALSAHLRLPWWLRIGLADPGVIQAPIFSSNIHDTTSICHHHLRPPCRSNTIWQTKVTPPPRPAMSCHGRLRFSKIVITPFSAASSSPHPFAEDISPIFPPATASYGRRSWSFSVSPPSPLLMHGRRLSDDDVVTPATAVRLPPIRNILTDKQPERRKDSHIVEVDAAVAMMQLASNSRQIITKKRNSELCQQNERPG